MLNGRINTLDLGKDVCDGLNKKINLKYKWHPGRAPKSLRENPTKRQKNAAFNVEERRVLIVMVEAVFGEVLSVPIVMEKGGFMNLNLSVAQLAEEQEKFSLKNLVINVMELDKFPILRRDNK